jgi:hypothetical protein
MASAFTARSPFPHLREQWLPSRFPLGSLAGQNHHQGGTLISKNRGARVLLLGALAVVALSAFASPAMAEFKTAKWDTTYTKTSTPSSLTVEKKGVAKTCTLSGTWTTPIWYESVYWPETTGTGRTHFNCSGGTELEMFFFAEAQRDSVTGATRLELGESGYGEASPWGTYGTLPFTVPYTNGSGATLSTITFNKTIIGKIGSTETITLTGALKVANLKNEAAKIIP